MLEYTRPTNAKLILGCVCFKQPEMQDGGNNSLHDTELMAFLVFLFNYKVRRHTLSLCISVRPSYLVLHSSTQVRETEKERSDCIFNNTIPVVLHLYMYNHIMISSGAYDPGLKVTDCMTAQGR